MIYLDYNATTPIAPEVAAEMQIYIHEHFGNPSSNHEYGTVAKAAVENARERVAACIGASPEEIIFTSGGSESNNTVIKGVAFTYKQKGNHIITSLIEHPAVLKPCRHLEQSGYSVSYAGVDEYGMVDPDEIEKLIREDTILVTIMHANNETGTIQPVKEIAEICRGRGVLFHTDAAQSIGKIPVDVNELGVDFLTIAGHKLYAPKGIGALYIRSGLSVEPLIHGASHEHGRRAGTENVIFDAALGRACELASGNNANALKELKDYFLKRIKDIFGSGIILFGHPELSLPNTLYIGFKGFKSEGVFEALRNVAFSTGSACHSGTTTLSPVLKAMGISAEPDLTTIRFSLGKYTTKEELNSVIEDLESLSNRNV